MTNAMTPGTAAARSPTRSAKFDAALIAALALSLLFFLEGLVFIPYVGLQNDELLFAEVLYQPLAIEHSVRIFHHQVPVMVMSYIGALKSWLFAPVFALWPPSPWSVRLPVLFLGAITVAMFFALVRRTCGRRAAVVSTALLATDATFVLTTCLDWGPVALQHFLLISGLLALCSFDANRHRIWLFAGFFAFGLALWDKALFSWSFVGLAAAASIVLPRTLARHFSARNVLTAALALTLGAAPLLLYNKAQKLKTLRSNAEFTTDRIPSKVAVMRASLKGTSLFGYVMRDDAPLEMRRPANALESASLALSNASGEERSGYFELALIVAFALLPWLWTTPARKPMLFALIFLLVTWAQMLLTKGAGGGAHHTVLLWPFPQLFVGVAFAQGSVPLRRLGAPALAAAAIFVCGSNVIALNQAFSQLIERGTTVIWTDAIQPLAGSLKRLPAGNMYIADWGMLNVLRAVDEGSLPIAVANDPFKQSPIEGPAREIALRMLARKDAIWIGHTDGNEVLKGVSERLGDFAHTAGYEKQVMQVIPDRNGRPIFEIYRWKRGADAP